MIFYCIGSKERGDMTMMNRIRSRFGFTVCLLVLLIVALAVPASAANYKKLYGTTKDRLRLRESASSNATTIDNLAKDRCVYIIQSKDSGGITWIEVKYRTHEGGTETGWVAQTDGRTTFVTVLSTSQAKNYTTFQMEICRVNRLVCGPQKSVPQRSLPALLPRTVLPPAVLPVLLRITLRWHRVSSRTWEFMPVR